MSVLKTKFEEKITGDLVKEFNYKNKFQIPKLEKVVINMGLGENIQNPKVLDIALEELGLISGQKPVGRSARLSISNFKLRQGVKIGASVTLRKRNMYEFLNRLINVALARLRDFRGISPKSFDGRGNYNLGIREQIIFPEINYDRVDKIRGMNITIVTTAKTNNEGLALLKGFGMPFRS